MPCSRCIAWNAPTSPCLPRANRLKSDSTQATATKLAKGNPCRLASSNILCDIDRTYGLAFGCVFSIKEASRDALESAIAVPPMMGAVITTMQSANTATGAPFCNFGRRNSVMFHFLTLTQSSNSARVFLDGLFQVVNSGAFGFALAEFSSAAPWALVRSIPGVKYLFASMAVFIHRLGLWGLVAMPVLVTIRRMLPGLWQSIVAFDIRAPLTMRVVVGLGLVLRPNTRMRIIAKIVASGTPRLGNILKLLNPSIGHSEEIAKAIVLRE